MSGLGFRHVQWELHLHHPHGLRDSLHLHPSPIQIGHPVDGAGKVRRCLTDQHLARLRYSAQPGRQVERAAAEPGLDRDRLTNVDSHADQQWQRRVRPDLAREPLLELNRCTDRRTWRSEHAQRLITAQLDQLTAPLSHDLADEPGKAPRQSGRSLVAVLLRKRGIAANIRDQKHADRIGWRALIHSADPTPAQRQTLAPQRPWAPQGMEKVGHISVAARKRFGARGSPVRGRSAARAGRIDDDGGVADTFASRYAAVRSEKGPLAWGLDPSGELLDSWGLGDTPDGLDRFADIGLRAAVGTVGLVKLQSAFYERHGWRGFRTLQRLIAEARSSASQMAQHSPCVASSWRIGRTAAGDTTTASTPFRYPTNFLSPPHHSP